MQRPTRSPLFDSPKKETCNSSQMVGLSWLQKKASSWTERLSAHRRLTVTTARHSSKGRRLCFCLSILITLLSARYGPHDSRSSNSHDPSSTHPDEVLHVKRFCYDVSVGGVVKVMKQVRFGPELEIGPGMCLCFFPSFVGGRVGLILCRYDSTNSRETITLIKISSICRHVSFIPFLPPFSHL